MASPRDRLPPGPGPGRPKGSKTKLNVQKLVDKQLTGMIGQSVEVVRADLDPQFKGKPTKAELKLAEERKREAAYFLLGKFAPKPGPKTYIEHKLSNVLDNYDDLAQISREAILTAMDGDMSFEQVEHLQRLITSHAGIEGYMQVKDLREELERLAEIKTVEGNRAVPAMSQLTWGSKATKQPTHEGSETPAE